MKKLIKVVAAIIENKEHEILCALRSPTMTMPNMWEFPGGKVEEDEDIYSALEREIEEELGCRIVTLLEKCIMRTFMSMKRLLFISYRLNAASLREFQYQVNIPS